MHALALAGSAVSIILVIFGSNTRAAAQMPPVATPDARGATTAAPQNTARALRGGGASQVGANGAPIILEVNKGTLIRLTAPAATVYRQPRYCRCAGQVAFTNLSQRQVPG